MVKFIDGPAAGQVLDLRRVPVILRVVCLRGKFDALDLPDDQPKPAETIHVYRLAREPTHIHICSRGHKGSKAIAGYWPTAEYEQVITPPCDAILRDNAFWGQWCDANVETLAPEWWKAKRAAMAAGGTQ